MARRIHPWPLGIIIFFIVLAVFNVGLVFVAYNGRPGKTEEDPWGASLRYDEVLAQEARAQALGLRAELAPGDIASDGSREVRITLEPTSVSSSLSQVSLSAFYPASKDKDVMTELSAGDAPGTFVGRAPLGRNGVWVFTLAAHDTTGSVLRIKWQQELGPEAERLAEGPADLADPLPD